MLEWGQRGRHLLFALFLSFDDAPAYLSEGAGATARVEGVRSAVCPRSGVVVVDLLLLGEASRVEVGRRDVREFNVCH